MGYRAGKIAKKIKLSEILTALVSLKSPGYVPRARDDEPRWASELVS